MRKKLDIIYEDKELLILNKEAKKLAIATAKEKNRTLYEEASEYVKKKHPKNKVFIVNRLDKDTSGLVVFAKNEKSKKYYQENWNSCVTREYLAIVEGKLVGSGTIKNYLKEDKTFRVYITNEKNGVLAITHYETLAYNQNYSLLKIQIETGKKHQIRVGLSGIHHPIIGDKKYGSTKNPIHRLGLHASYMEMKTKNQNISFFAPVPKEMKQLFEDSINTYEQLRSKGEQSWKDYKKL